VDAVAMVTVIVTTVHGRHPDRGRGVLCRRQRCVVGRPGAVSR